MHQVCQSDFCSPHVGERRSVAGRLGVVGGEIAQDVRRVLYDGDESATLAIACSLGQDGPLPQAGELVLLAVDHDAPETAEFAARCSEALPRVRVRGLAR